MQIPVSVFTLVVFRREIRRHVRRIVRAIVDERAVRADRSLNHCHANEYRLSVVRQTASMEQIVDLQSVRGRNADLEAVEC
jgi:hypothetical protein